MIVLIEMALITPPVGLNLYVVQGVRGDKGAFTDVIYGAVPYAMLMLLFTSALIFWPSIATWLPQAVGR